MFENNRRRITDKMAQWWTFAAALFVICLSVITCNGSDTPENPVVGPYKGVIATDMLDLSGSELTDRVADYQTLGIKWIRFNFDWSLIQPSAGTYNLAKFDEVVKALSTAGINVLGIIDFSPSWANGAQPSKFYPPTDVADYARLAGYLAAHFGPKGVHAWEIWNEPNLAQFWQPKPDVVAYTALLKAAYIAIHRADPDATVITGGLAQPSSSPTTISALEFVQGIYTNGGRDYFDAMGDHPYDSPQVPGSPFAVNWRRMFATLPSFRGIMVANGDSRKKIWITEIGAPTQGVSASVVSEECQAEILTRAYDVVRSYTWVGPLFWYNYQDYCPYGTKDTECYYGLIRHDGSQKPSYRAFRLALQ